VTSKLPDRRLLAALAGVVLLVLLIVAVASGGASEQPPATGAAAVVPGDALAYVHVSIDSSRPAVKRASALAGKFPDYPLLRALVTNRLAAIAGGSRTVDFSRQIRPWLGNEAALALLNTQTTTAGSLIVLDVRDHNRAQSFVDRVGARPAGSYRGTQLRLGRSGTTAAFIQHYLVLGQDASVRAAVDVASGNGTALQESDAYKHAAAGEPADRVLDVYASVAGVRRLLAPQGGVLGALGVLLYQPALTGVTVSLSPATGGARVRVHSALDPKLVHLNGGGAGAFAPSLADQFPRGTTVLLELQQLDRNAGRILQAGAAGGIVGGLGKLLTKLGTALVAEGVNVRDVLSIFHGEAAVAIAPTARRTAAAARPSLVIVARTNDEARTRSALAALEVPLAQLFPAPSQGPGQASTFNDRTVDGVAAHQLALAPGLELDYAVFRGLVVVATSLDGIASVVSHGQPITDTAGYRATLAGRPDKVTSLLFADFSQLLRLSEQTGLTRSARFRALRGDLAKVRAVGLSSKGGEADSTAELLLQIP
jgi:hypothetical protein